MVQFRVGLVEKEKSHFYVDPVCIEVRAFFRQIVVQVRFGNVTVHIVRRLACLFFEFSCVPERMC